jgi:hypothetical protein
MELTEQQLRFFDAFGFQKFPGLFAEEMGKITNGFEQVWAEHGGGRRQSSRMTGSISFLVPVQPHSLGNTGFQSSVWFRKLGLPLESHHQDCSRLEPISHKMRRNGMVAR